MVVHHVEYGDNPETEDMYDATIHSNDEMKTGEEVKDDAQNNIIAEDKVFEKNQDKLNFNSNAVDLEFVEK